MPLGIADQHGIGHARQGGIQSRLMRMHGLLGMFALSNVLGDPSDPSEGTCLIVHREAPVAEPAQRAIGADDPKFLVVPARGDLAEEGRLDPWPILGVNGLDPFHKVSVQGLGTPSHDLFIGRADVVQAALLGVRDPEDVAHRGSELPKARLALP